MGIHQQLLKIEDKSFQCLTYFCRFIPLKMLKMVLLCRSSPLEKALGKSIASIKG